MRTGCVDHLSAPDGTPKHRTSRVGHQLADDQFCGEPVLLQPPLHQLAFCQLPCAGYLFHIRLDAPRDVPVWGQAAHAHGEKSHVVLGVCGQQVTDQGAAHIFRVG